jgi:hypothetical protein
MVKLVYFKIVFYIPPFIQLIRMPFIFTQTLDAHLMASSLAAMLSSLPLFAGRLRTSSSENSKTSGNGRYQVSLCNKGASLTIATCDSMLQHIFPAELLSPVDDRGESFLYSAPDLSPFLPAIPSSILGYCNRDEVPLLHAQITHLHGGGTVLAVVIPHVIADQETCRLVLKVWAEGYTAACIAAQGEMNNRNGPNRWLSAIFEEEESIEEEFCSSSSGRSTSSSNENLEDEEEVSSSCGEEIFSNNGTSRSLSSSGENSEQSLDDISNNLEAYAAPVLPPNWTSLRFEKRSWSFYPSVACSFFWHVGSLKNLSTVTYYVSASRLSALKHEASQDLYKAGSEAPCAPAWISKNDALAARIRQVIAQLSGKLATSPMQLWVNLRKRMVPPLPYPALGNCSWTVAVKTTSSTAAETTSSSIDGSSSSLNLNLGSLAAEVRTAIQTVNNQEYISQELRWLEDAFSSNGGSSGASMPCVFQNATEILKPSGPLLLSHWDWGGSSYSDLQFGPPNIANNTSSAPIWHQPPHPKVPNCVFVVPAAPGVGARKAAGGGVLVHITLHKRLAEEMKRMCPAL